MIAFSEPYNFEERKRCPGCHENGSKTRFRSEFADGGIGKFVREYYHVDTGLLAARPYQLEECTSCSLVFQKFVGDDSLLSDLYTHWVDEPEDPERDIDTYRADISAIRLSRDAHEIMAAASFTGTNLSDLKTLDYGMGWALWARISKALGCQSFGSDLSQPRMEFARRHGVAAVNDEEISGLTFDFINTEQVFEHVPEPLDLLCRLAKSLKHGGVIKLSLPSAERVDTLIGLLADGGYAGDYKTIVQVQPLEHINSFKMKSIFEMASKAGLKVVKPSLWHRYAFLRHTEAVNLSRPKKTIKELVRPVYQHRDPSNLFVWLQHP